MLRDAKYISFDVVITPDLHHKTPIHVITTVKWFYVVKRQLSHSYQCMAMGTIEIEHAKQA